MKRDDTARIVVAAAMDDELAALARRVGTVDERRVGDLRLRRGRLGGVELWLARTGDGRARAERSLEALFEHVAVDRLLVIGISGGLTPGLAAGSLVVAGEVLDGLDAAPPPDRIWLEAAAAEQGLRVGRAVSAERIAWSREQKASLLETLPPGDGPAVVDLESAAFARAASANGLPYLVVRTVCDPAEKALPFDLNRCLDESGGVSRAKVLRYAAFHPAVLGPLMELREQVDRCSGVLADCVEGLLAGQISRPAERDAAGSLA